MHRPGALQVSEPGGLCYARVMGVFKGIRIGVLGIGRSKVVSRSTSIGLRATEDGGGGGNGPSVRVRPGGPSGPDTQRVLRKAAVIAQSLILQRAFPGTELSGKGLGDISKSGRGRSVDGKTFPPLSEAYGWYKSGTRPYVSRETRARAVKKRAASGKPGPGPLVDVLGIKTLLGRRPNESNIIIS